MVFNSFSFGFFFLTVTSLYFFIPKQWQWVWLLAASCYFYMALIPVYILILFLLIGIDYVCGINIEKTAGLTRKRWLMVSICGNIGILFLFKYFNFFNANVAAVADFFHWHYSLDYLRLALPVGLSFHVFQSLSYVIEVYRGKQPAEHHLGYYALYVMFFPQLVAGPIERPQNLLHQFKEYHQFDYNRVTSGLRLMLWGFFKKLVIADRLSILVDHVYRAPNQTNGVVLAIATVAFAIQIFCDFSGYSDIARGSARILGFKLMNNFSQPYAAESISDFWRRWHISLSTWFKDYVYFPLGGNRVKLIKWCRNILVVFLLSGLWHGASWNYVIWGSLHGLMIIVGRLIDPLKTRMSQLMKLTHWPKLRHCFSVVTTFLLICLTWIFFRAPGLSEAGLILKRLVIGWNQVLNPVFWVNSVWNEATLGLGNRAIIVCGLAILLMECVHYIERHEPVSAFLARRPTWQRWVLYYVLTSWILLFGYFGNGVFIYFQF